MGKAPRRARGAWSDPGSAGMATLSVPQNAGRGPKRANRPQIPAPRGDPDMPRRCPNLFPVFGICAVPLALGACSAQRDTSYRGDPLAVLHGNATNDQGGQPPALDVALFWYMGAVDNNNPPPGSTYSW